MKRAFAYTAAPFFIFSLISCSADQRDADIRIYEKNIEDQSASVFTEEYNDKDDLSAENSQEISSLLKKMNDYEMIRNIDSADTVEAFDFDGIKAVSSYTYSVSSSNGSGKNGIVLNLYNESDDARTVDLRNFKINGLFMPGNILVSESVDPGASVSADTELIDNDLKRILGFDELNEVDMEVEVSGSTFPSGSGRTSAHLKYGEDTRDYFSTGKILTDNDSLLAVHKGILNSFDKYEIFIICRNKTSEDLVLDSDNTISVNGEKVNCIFSDNIIRANSSAVLKIETDRESLKAKSIYTEFDIHNYEITFSDSSSDDNASFLFYYERDMI